MKAIITIILLVSLILNYYQLVGWRHTKWDNTISPVTNHENKGISFDKPKLKLLIWVNSVDCRYESLMKQLHEFLEYNFVLDIFIGSSVRCVLNSVDVKRDFNAAFQGVNHIKMNVNHYDYFLYIEDDIIINSKQVRYLIENNKKDRFGFLRVEQKKMRLTDDSLKDCDKYFCRDNSYEAFVFLKKEDLIEIELLKLWDNKHGSGMIREDAAGLSFMSLYYNNNKIPKDTFCDHLIIHLSNKYDAGPLPMNCTMTDTMMFNPTTQTNKKTLINTQTDKHTIHEYTPFYELLISNVMPVEVSEIGIGCGMAYGGGGSYTFWRHFGIVYVNYYDIELCNISYNATMTKFDMGKESYDLIKGDFIVDDGSHKREHQLKTLDFAIRNCMRKTVVIEDLFFDPVGIIDELINLIANFNIDCNILIGKSIIGFTKTIDLGEGDSMFKKEGFIRHFWSKENLAIYVNQVKCLLVEDTHSHRQCSSINKISLMLLKRGEFYVK